jgi:putative PIN family toxin of toxin-antitoxin system
VIRTVLDTNVLVSALLFSGEIGNIVSSWKARKFLPVFSHDTFDEFRRVLAYPKFSLTSREIEVLIQDEVLPFCEVVDIEEDITGICRERADDKFLSCAVAATADYIVSGAFPAYSGYIFFNINHFTKRKYFILNKDLDFPRRQ